MGKALGRRSDYNLDLLIIQNCHAETTFKEARLAFSWHHSILKRCINFWHDFVVYMSCFKFVQSSPLLLQRFGWLSEPVKMIEQTYFFKFSSHFVQRRRFYLFVSWVHLNGFSLGSQYSAVTLDWIRLWKTSICFDSINKL